MQIAKSPDSSSSPSQSHTMLRIENLPAENPGIASGSIMTLADVAATPLRSTANKEKPDVILSQNRRSVEAQKVDTKRTFVESEYVKNPENTYSGQIGHERQKLLEKA